MEYKRDLLRYRYIVCPTIEETEKVILILFSYGFKWRSGCTTVNPGYERLYPLGNIIFTDYDLVISYGDLSKKDSRSDNREEIELEDFLENF